jgi:hypothetical protein
LYGQAEQPGGNGERVDCPAGDMESARKQELEWRKQELLQQRLEIGEVALWQQAAANQRGGG